MVLEGDVETLNSTFRMAAWVDNPIHIEIKVIALELLIFTEIEDDVRIFLFEPREEGWDTHDHDRKQALVSNFEV